jgi:hypothetical protein
MTYTDFKYHTWQAAKETAKAQIVEHIKKKNGKVGDIYWVMDTEALSVPADSEAHWLIGGTTKWLGGHSQEASVSDVSHEYVVQGATHKQFSRYEVFDLATNTVVWGADTTEECYDWINQTQCEYCLTWTDDAKVVNGDTVCPDCVPEAKKAYNISDIGEEQK